LKTSSAKTLVSPMMLTHTLSRAVIPSSVRILQTKLCNNANFVRILDNPDLRRNIVTTKYVMGIDVGTEGSRAGIFSLDGTPIAFASSKHDLLFPKADWVEQHPETWWESATAASREAVEKSGLKPEQIVALSASGTGTTVVAAKKDGTPLRNAIMWMDV